MSPKGGGVDFPPSHSLLHFIDFPEALDYDEDYCFLCNPRDRVAKVVAIRNSPDRLRGDFRLVGNVQGFEVFDLLYYAGAITPDRLVWKSILVKAGPDQYHEIYHYQAIFGPGIVPSTIVGNIVASESWLGAKSMMTEEYFGACEK